jgi:hypothetical protein
LSYLIRNGSERVVTSAREHLYDLRSLENFTYTDELGKDQGINGKALCIKLVDLIFGVLMPLSAIFQLYHGDQF